jgi:hypothetical protein
MRTAKAWIHMPGVRIAQIEELWYDTSRWPAFVDGCKHVHDVTGPYPQAGGRVRWESFPSGRGKVLEVVERHETRAGQRCAVQDPSIIGHQEVRFTATDDGVRIDLRLEYELRRRTALTPFTDVLFIRRAQADALQRTLVRFAHELRSDLDPSL